MSRIYDLVVVGGGAAGIVAAREASRRGASVVIVQDGPIGGDCTFTGCIPSKTLLAAAADGSTFDEAMARVHRTVERIASTEDAAALADDGIDVVDGVARFTSPTTIHVDGTAITSKRFVVATGARPTRPPIPGLEASRPLTSDTLFDLPARPESMIVVGGGPIGCEMSQAFARLGTRITLIEALDRVLPNEEPDASAVIADVLAGEGVDIRVGASVERITRRDTGQVCVDVADGDASVAAELLVATGRTPSGRGIGLEELGVDIDTRGAVVVDDTMATAVDGIWAVGDVTGGLQFTHAAARMGWVAASNALSTLARVRRFRFDAHKVPWATFTTPEVGRVGLTEAQAAAVHRQARVAHLALEQVDRAVTAGAENGFVKLIAAPNPVIGHLGGGRLVGATIVSPTGGDLIHEAALAMQTNMLVGRLAQTTHAYPSWAMAIQQAALQFLAPVAGLHARPAEARADGPTAPSRRGEVEAEGAGG